MEKGRYVRRREPRTGDREETSSYTNECEYTYTNIHIYFEIYIYLYMYIYTLVYIYILWYIYLYPDYVCMNTFLFSDFLKVSSSLRSHLHSTVERLLNAFLHTHTQRCDCIRIHPNTYVYMYIYTYIFMYISE